ncbi:lipoprotein-anchoring transpeptidase ErfK/SrfK [Acinetobacter baylyi]|uniref:Lipoprotein-anchoring transpeptidase ErfK/SrfK n=1 Tax=Acinetobacter baylyi TaxID=202950 RepID=A0ABU0V1E9_ACIBI|nr:L,D-transpeptidase [Acinetobacter baylyi]MDQ1210323.1 lipoprotein-anchoring transpeptidase ErfK/SrfK [Acinetobacter baylyi]MDR6106082.1 lipoprotein-anchoring transpeptidase ErfK/SrfK [Acinetobacter baylyi]MDR6187194.1 lipoprotein-anchoring transpeptidase ErfK/SrfK [Acinetobacter baylyi]
MFVRSLLALSLSCIISGTVFAASTVEQPLHPKVVRSTDLIEDPIDPLAVDSSVKQKQNSTTKYKPAAPVPRNNAAASSPVASAPASSPVASQAPASSPTSSSGDASLSAQEQKDLNQASATLQNLENSEDKHADSGAAPTTPATKTSTPSTTSSQSQAKVSWTLDSLNNADWYENIGRGQFPVYARAQVMLNNTHASPGAIDGTSGMNTLKAISSFQQMNGLKPTGELTQETWNALVAKQNKPAYVEYTLTEDDLKGPYAPSIPHDYAQQAKMKGLYYVRVTEMLGEKFHMDEDFLKKLNPKASFKKAGEKIIVANVRNDLPEDIHLIIAHKGARQLYLFNSRNQMIASFPATIGSSDTPSPTGTYKVVGVARNPWYSYSPSNFVQGNNLKPLSLPPGPNAPVGNIWIGLSKKSFGIHGTPNPSAISKTASHGCIRLTNWDANDLGNKVRSGVTVKFLE